MKVESLELRGEQCSSGVSIEIVTTDIMGFFR